MEKDTIVSVDCQTIDCKNKVYIHKGSSHFGIFCKKCWERKNTYTTNYEM